MRWGLLLSSVLALAGCKVGPDYRLPSEAMVNAPSAQGRFVLAKSTVSAEEPPPIWWRLYNDPVLDRLIKEALASNTDLRVAEASLKSSEALLQEAKAAREPDVSLGASTSYSQFAPEAYLRTTPITPFQFYDLGLSISYDLDLFGGLRRGIEAEKDRDQAVAAARDLVRVNVVAETARAYADVCDAGHELATARRSLALQQDAAHLTSRLEVAGRAVSFDVTRQQAQVDQLRATLPALEARQTNALLRLATLRGRTPREMEPELASCATPPRLLTPLPVGDGAALLRRRPDIRAAERRLAAATATIGVATADLYPHVRLNASIGTTGVAQSFLSNLTNRYAVGPGLTWELNQSVARARIARAKADTQAQLARFDGTVLTALQETESALNNYGHDLDQLASLRASRDRSAQVAGDATRLLSAGRIDALSALDAQRTLAASEQALAAAESQISMDQIAIFLALGGGWETRAVRPEG
jgi:NodT family efflux transporter outer membrane factor (OMF) lipoprotein